jgi:hypothetical protein
LCSKNEKGHLAVTPPAASQKNGFELASDGAWEKAQEEEAKGELRHGMLVDDEAATAMHRH